MKMLRLLVLCCFSSLALADTAGPTYATAQTFMVHVEADRITGSLWRCRGACRSAASDGTHVKIIGVPVMATPSSPTHETGATQGACLTTLAADCTDTAVANSEQ